MPAPTATPKIAHGIARLHPESQIPDYLWRRGPAWALPPARTGDWYIHKIYNAAVRVEFDEALPKLGRSAADVVLDEARSALSSEEEARRDDWLGWADKHEAEAFVRSFNVRKRREHGDLPSFEAGAYVRDRPSGVWHIATGQNGATWDPADRMTVGTECPNTRLSVDLGAVESFVKSTTDPDRVCKSCAARIEARQRDVEAAEAVRVPA